MRKAFQIIALLLAGGLCGFLIRGWCFDSSPGPVPYYASDRGDYLLTGKQYELLKREALTKLSPEAAVRIANYHKRYEHDSAEGTKWLMLAEQLGDRNAAYRLSQIDKAIRDEARLRFNNASSNPENW